MEKYPRQILLSVCIVVIILFIFAVGMISYAIKSLHTSTDVKNLVETPNVTVSNTFQIDPEAAEMYKKGAEAQLETAKLMKEVYRDPEKFSRARKVAEKVYLSEITSNDIYYNLQNLIQNDDIDPLYSLNTVREKFSTKPSDDEEVYIIEQHAYIEVVGPDGKSKPTEYDKIIQCSIDIIEQTIQDCNIPFIVDFDQYMRPEPPKPTLLAYVPIWG